MAQKSLKPLVIDRTRWLRGDEWKSMLRDEVGNMCCLGFACLAKGLDPEQIAFVPRPDDLDQSGEELDDWELNVVERAMEINDDYRIDDMAREARLVPVLAKLGFAVTFVDGE